MQQKDATEQTKAANIKYARELPFSNTEDFNNATRGFLGTTDDLFIASKSDAPIWTLQGYEFLQRRYGASKFVASGAAKHAQRIV